VNLDNFWANAFWSLAPSVGIGVIFWFIFRSIIRADRNERDAYSKIEREERAKRAAPSESANVE